MTDKLLATNHHGSVTAHPEPRKGRRRGDVDINDLSRREIDKTHRNNGIFLLSELTLIRKAHEDELAVIKKSINAILRRDIEAMLIAADGLKNKGDIK